MAVQITTQFATGFVWALTVWVVVGLIVGVPFILRGVGRVDPLAAEGSVGFRLAILPGVVALWPLVLRRWKAGPPPPTERNAHRDAASDA